MSHEVSIRVTTLHDISTIEPHQTENTFLYLSGILNPTIIMQAAFLVKVHKPNFTLVPRLTEIASPPPKWSSLTMSDYGPLSNSLPTSTEHISFKRPLECALFAKPIL